LEVREAGSVLLGVGGSLGCCKLSPQGKKGPLAEELESYLFVAGDGFVRMARGGEALDVEIVIQKSGLWYEGLGDGADPDVG
jgi:hypothetical protein